MESTEYLFARKLLHVMNNRQIGSFTFYMSESERAELIKVCADIKNDIGWNFRFQDFYKVFSSYCFPSLEFLWNLHILQILPLEFYLIYTEKKIVQKFKESVIRLCIQDFGESDEQYLIQTGFLTFFIRKAFDVTDSVNCDEDTKEIYLVTVKELLQGIFMMDEKETGTKRLCCFFSLWNAGILEEITLQNFCLFAIDYYLNFCPATNDLSAFRVLDNTDSSSAPYHLLPVVERLLKSQIFIGLSQTFALAAQKTQTDIKRLLVATRAFLKTHEEASHFLKKFVLELMSEAYENLNYNLLLKALLVGRQVVFQPNAHLHVCYKHWLQNVFNDCGHLKNIQCFLLLLQVLTDLVPFHENVECLKVAIDLNVHVPPEAQLEYSDYIVLLKTRVQDLKPQSKPGETVEKVLSLFEILGKIPPVIMEASLLQKHRFLNEFLPALLSPRVVPQIPDVRERFIEALDKAAKIPSNMLQKYRNECQQEQEQLLAGINMIDENFDDLLKDSE